MAKFEFGASVLESLNAEETKGNGDIQFTSFKTGTSLIIQVLSLQSIIKYMGYGIYKEVNTFVAENPSIFNEKGYPKSNLTPWDKAFNYYSNLAFNTTNKAEQDELRTMSRRYLGKERYAFGFINLLTGEPGIIDVSKNQARVIINALQKNEAKFGKKAFELEKVGTGKNTTVSVTPLDLEDLTPEALEVFNKYLGKEFDNDLFENILYEADEKEQLDLLEKAGFDLSLIGEGRQRQATAQGASQTQPDFAGFAGAGVKSKNPNPFAAPPEADGTEDF